MVMVAEGEAAAESNVILVVVIREYDPKKDINGVEELEKKCDVGPSDKLSLFTDHMGDPICRVRHSPVFSMLVAEMISSKIQGEEEEGSGKEIVGTIRGSVKTVACGKDGQDHAKLAYVSGLRVSPSHRRFGIGLKLVQKIEEWFTQNGADYSYMATEKDNFPSVKLFTGKCGYSKFRTPAILIQPVFAHQAPISNRVNIIKLEPSDAETLYRRRFSTTEFFPQDIDAVLNNKLSLGTFLAVPRGSGSWVGSDKFLDDPPESWAVLSVWNCQFQLEVKGNGSRVKKWLARKSRSLDRAFPWLRVPSVPEFFRPFGIHFLYGLGGEGVMAARLMKALCGMAHNLAMERGGGVVAAEVAAGEKFKEGIPHWKRLSCAEDLWCIKRLGGGEKRSEGDDVGDWTRSTPGLSLFVDPREI
ncbi:probable N-acetyltransferase HLS1 [Impatiens glandulifera]|uniref:probable N-acetyltransferase HLS1 n=1 Tax=Impatiens glandulifera TaxID=253017 RepID=UPI001FB18CE8|nr:probable N-acetyltransferase HLS1 [Impatiens glandulifera]